MKVKSVSKTKTERGKPKAVKTRIKKINGGATKLAQSHSSNPFESILERISDGFVAFDADMNYTYVSNKGGELLGRKPEDLVGKNYWKEYPEAKDTPFANAYLRALKEQTAIQIEEYYEPFDRWFENRIHPSREGLSIFFQDITERKQAEEKLRLSEERFSNAFHVSPVGLTITRISDGKFIDANESFLGMFEFTREEAIGHTSTELKILSPEERAKLIQAQVESGGLHHAELVSRSKSGRIIHLLFSSKPMELEGETCHVTTMIDITERKRVEENLKKRYKELGAIYESAQHLQKLLSPDTLAHKVIEALEGTLDYTFGAVLLVDEATGILEPFAVSSQKRGAEYMRADMEYVRSKGLRLGVGITGWVAERGESVRLGDVRQDNRYYDLRNNINSELCVPMRVQDRVIGVVNVESIQPRAYSEDDQRVLETVAAQIAVAIQNTRLLDELRLSRDRLAELSRRLVEIHETEQRAIGRELHDQIGQMLTALKLTLEIAAQLPAETAAKKLIGAQELVDDLMSRVSRLSLELRPPMLDDLGLIPALLWHITRFQEQTHINVEFKHGDIEGKRFDPEIETTAYRVAQESLTNVARHARATRVRLKVQIRGGWMEIQIEDNGVGFDPQTALAKNRGLGGMRERINLLGGSFEIESQAGAGAKKLIRLPIQENPQ
ncbi:MAG: PAS domain S-box protein [Chloroflexi bacterium]|nr:PAS domain S-box protein [Chloroflexota bacterium]